MEKVHILRLVAQNVSSTLVTWLQPNTVFSAGGHKAFEAAGMTSVADKSDCPGPSDGRGEVVSQLPRRPLSREFIG